MAQDILIIIDCEKPLKDGTLPQEAVSMYAMDPSIVQPGTQGSPEISVKVPPSTNLRWRAVPLQGDGNWHVLITQVKLWGANDSNQLDATMYLREWFASTGNATTNVPVYQSGFQDFSFGPATPDPLANYKVESYTSNVAAVAPQPFNGPFVQATCGDTMDSTKSVAYSFVCTVYKGGETYATVAWDPKVTISS